VIAFVSLVAYDLPPQGSKSAIPRIHEPCFILKWGTSVAEPPRCDVVTRCSNSDDKIAQTSVF
jgi:hypothetical protein